MASVTPDRTKFSIAETSPVSRERTSPSRRRSKNARDRRWRWRKKSVRRDRRNRSAIQLETYWSKNDSVPARTVSPRYASAIQTSGPKFSGTRPLSTKSLNIQIIAVSTAATAAISSSPTTSQRRKGRAYGQKRRKISRIGTGGAAATSACESRAGMKNVRTVARRRRNGRDLDAIPAGGGAPPPSTGPPAGACRLALIG